MVKKEKKVKKVKKVKLAQVSSLGRFCNTRGVKYTPTPRANGYVRVSIRGKSYLIHRLIAVAFELPQEADQTTVDHKDNNPGNNHLSNLRWASPHEQVRHSYATNATRKSNATKRSKPVRGRRVGATEWTEYPSVREAARELKRAEQHRLQVTTAAARMMHLERDGVPTLGALCSARGGL